jgi:ectoine hydroxylase-related dioxygenase (phytanoyl-CoA dioxygenase family)
VTALPELDDTRFVATDVVAGFRRDGHALVRGLLSAEEVQAYRPVIEAAAAHHNRETRPLAERSTYGKAFLQIMNLWRHDDAVAKFVLAHRFASAAAQLLDVEAVRLYHDQALFKEPGGGPTPFHQDQYYWPLDTDLTITMWMPLVDVAAQVGSMTFGSGSHRLGFLGHHAISDESDVAFRSMVDARGIALATHGALTAGDATFHSGWTLHGAPANPTPMMRSVMTVIYFADGARVSEPMNDAQRHDLAAWLPGLHPGDLAASPINPRLGR